MNMFFLKTKSLAISLLIFCTLFSNISSAKAAVVLGYIDAWQALNINNVFYGKTVAQQIADEAQEHNLNPRLLLILLQRESSSITQATPSSQTRAAWPLFYMYDERMANCLNGIESECNDIRYGTTTYRERAYDYGGVGQQIAYASYNLQRQREVIFASNYNQPVTISGESITCQNAASRALYAYTPHLSAYNTASAFYTNWVSWWGATPNGGEYNASYIISDANFTNSAPMTASEINNFLISKGSWMANYVIPEYVSTPYPMIYTAPPEPPPAEPPPPPPPPPRKLGDCNSDNIIDITDLSILSDTWGKQVDSSTGADFNGDGIVDIIDLSILSDNWGK